MKNINIHRNIILSLIISRTVVVLSPPILGAHMMYEYNISYMNFFMNWMRADAVTTGFVLLFSVIFFITMKRQRVLFFVALANVILWFILYFVWWDVNLHDLINTVTLNVKEMHVGLLGVYILAIDLLLLILATIVIVVESISGGGSL
ncbi:hypothetical protein [Ostreibacterium oceani]|uniref:Uncharacterized protein n=1 Tax=Ostreibacterium oceani TaxID=2654998 RepID=A0A6N7ESK7_9GAMM|nr:hypothetical protein [Ostreibacterium oceani]MPV85824.1 hypothetical protein [Ostreibacterium oceani]